MNAQSLPAFVDGKTRLYGIIGDPIEQVKSPEILTANFRGRGRNAIMLPMHVLPGRFDETLRGLMALNNLDGIVITVPYKARITAFCDRLMPAGRRIGSINAMRREKDGSWSGDMFDGQGMVLALRNNGYDVKGARVMMVGAGGVGSAIADALAACGVSSLTVYDIDEQRARELAARVSEHHRHGGVRFGKPTQDNIDLLVNATAVGMNGQGLPVDFAKINPNVYVFDVITHDTPLLALARQCGCRSLGGLPMTKAQADLLVSFILGES
ncbi:MAG TPA: shikimate dehydrogenase [Pseudorhodoplanes sp.]|nr:shikimate dehydrogenase [Pseudorhodoplanes sp.]